MELLDERGGKPLPGFSASDCEPIIGDRLDALVSWKGGADLTGFAGQPIRVRIELRDAQLYALRFRQ